MQTTFTKQVGIEVPIICGAMYPCSNPELVAAVSEAGGIGVVQPLSMVYVHRHDFRAGLRLLRQLTKKPLGMNIIVEKSSKVYEDRMRHYLDLALEEGVRFFVTSLGNPRWVVDRVAAVHGVVYHDITERKWADKALAAGVHGLIGVNARAGGHAGTKQSEELFRELESCKVPLICAGGVGDEQAFVDALRLGYAGVQVGTRFIATTECRAHDDYKNAILNAREDDIVLSEKISGVPVAVIRTPYVDKMGLKAGPLARFLLQHHKTKHYMRMLYSVQSMLKLRKASLKGSAYENFFQAGRSVAGIDKIEPAGDIVRRFARAAEAASLQGVA